MPLDALCYDSCCHATLFHFFDAASMLFFIASLSIEFSAILLFRWLEVAAGHACCSYFADMAFAA